MCDECKSVMLKTKKTAGYWWAGLMVTILIFIISQVFMYGKITERINHHIENDPTHRQLTEEFVDKDEFNTIKEMVTYLYEKNGGK